MAICNFIPFPNLFTRRLILRQLSAADENEIFFLRSDENINEFTGIPIAASIDDAGKFIRKINDGIGNNEWIYWGISLKDDQKLIGTICLWNIDTATNLAEIGYVLSTLYQGKGLMQEAILKVVDYGCSVIQLSSIIADLHPQNTRSVKVLEKTGFIKKNSTAEKLIYELLNL